MPGDQYAYHRRQHYCSNHYNSVNGYKHNHLDYLHSMCRSSGQHTRPSRSSIHQRKLTCSGRSSIHQRKLTCAGLEPFSSTFGTLPNCSASMHEHMDQAHNLREQRGLRLLLHGLRLHQERSGVCLFLGCQ